MAITNHRLDGVRFVAATASGGELMPSLIILHDTAGRLDKGNTVKWFASPKCKVSAHIVIERDGTITQMVPFNRRAWHAGESEWNGRKFCNSFAIGIEIVNPGKLDAKGCAWFGQATTAPLRQFKTREHGDGYWLDYTGEQLAAIRNVCRALVEEYPDCNEIVTHWMVSPGRKIDCGPMLPLEEIRAHAFGLAEEPKAEAGHELAHAEDMATAEELAPPPPPSVKSSRKYGLADVWKQLLGWLGIGTFGTTAAADVTAVKGTLDAVREFVSAWGVEMLIGACVVGFVSMQLMQHWQKQDYEEGRYTPKGE